jgi:hypothetical protein
LPLFLSYAPLLLFFSALNFLPTLLLFEPGSFAFLLYPSTFCCFSLFCLTPSPLGLLLPFSFFFSFLLGDLLRGPALRATAQTHITCWTGTAAAAIYVVPR